MDGEGVVILVRSNGDPDFAMVPRLLKKVSLGHANAYACILDGEGVVILVRSNGDLQLLLAIQNNSSGHREPQICKTWTGLESGLDYIDWTAWDLHKKRGTYSALLGKRVEVTFQSNLLPV